MDDRQKSFVYTIYTQSGREHIVSENMDRLLTSGVITDKYIPMRELARKVQGEWTKYTDRFFPGYLFVETYDPELLYFQLKRVPGMSKLLIDGERNFSRLSDDEVVYINQIGALRNDHTFGLSQVEIDESRPELKIGDRVRIIAGDLLGFQGDIRKFDIHHRKAYIWTPLLGGQMISVGIELVIKD